MSRPAPSTADVSRRMSRQAQKDTGPELAIRRRLHAAGLRYRVDHPPIRGVRRRADIVFTKKKVAVFVDGCFWHSCPIHATQPKANAEWWADKLARNKVRDEETDRILEAAGWKVIRVWEHDDPADAAAQIVRIVRGK
ncbi:MAG: very short patch repair endonuclease [Ilumatobacteraceae bacterium]|nr:very short patch repair endonuclease [Ilumatobacteraceae bacterium]